MTDEVVLRFWTPISQLVPVLALAFVLEMRVQARNLPLDIRWLVRFQSFIWIITGIPLIVVEYWALDALVNNAAKEELLKMATGFVMGGVSGAIVVPVLSVLLTLNLDLAATIGRHIREIVATPRRRRLRRRAEQMLFRSHQMRAKYLGMEESTRETVRHIDDRFQLEELARMRANDTSLSAEDREMWIRWLGGLKDKSTERRKALRNFWDATHMQSEIDEAHREVLRIVKEVRGFRYDAKAPAEERDRVVAYMKTSLDRLASVA